MSYDQGRLSACLLRCLSLSIRHPLTHCRFRGTSTPGQFVRRLGSRSATKGMTVWILSQEASAPLLSRAASLSALANTTIQPIDNLTGQEVYREDTISSIGKALYRKKGDGSN